MSTLIDLCGTPIQLDKIKDFKLIKREYLFCPAYQETEEQKFSIFARRGAENKKKFKFTRMVPYGVLLSDKEKPQNGGYEIKSFGEAVTFNIIDKATKGLSDIAGIAADYLRIDTSGNKEYRILTQGRRLVTIKLRDIPAKVQFLSGKVSDVYKNDQYYEFLGESIAPAVLPVPALVINIDKATHVFFGGGIDMEDIESTYHMLFEAYNKLQEEKKHLKQPAALPKINIHMPKLNMPPIKLQSPFVISKKEAIPSEAGESEHSSQ